MLRTRLKRLLVLSVAVVALSAVAGLPAASAHQPGAGAAVTTERAAALAAPIAPSCVERFYHNHIVYKEVHLKNNCSGTRYVKVIVAYGPDSGCIRLVRFASGTHRWAYGWPFAASRFDRLELC